jgi:hypothetical protein
MSQGLADKVKATGCLAEALRIIEAESDRQGALKVSQGKTKGAVAFGGKKILGAFVKPTGENGRAALDLLLLLEGAALRLVDFDPGALQENERFELEIASVLEELSAGGKQPSENVAGVNATEGLTEVPTEAKTEVPSEAATDISTETTTQQASAADQAGEESRPEAEKADEQAAINLDRSDVDYFGQQQIVEIGLSDAFNTDVQSLTVQLALNRAFGMDPQQETTSEVPVASGARAAEKEDITVDLVVDPDSAAEMPVVQEADDNPLAAKMQQQASSLTEVQRKALDAHRQFADKEIFANKDSRLEVPPGFQITNKELELLASAVLDDKSFHHVDVSVQNEIPSLTEEQRSLLAKVADTEKDSAAFEELSAALRVSGLNVSEQRLWQLAEFIRGRSTEGDQAEFAIKDERLENQEEALLHSAALVEEALTAAKDSAAQLDQIPAPQIQESDRTPLILFHDQETLPAQRQVMKGMVDVVREFIKPRPVLASRIRRLRKRFPIGKVIGIASLVLLVIGTFTVPRMIRSMAFSRTTEQMALDQLNLAIQEDMSNQVPSASQDDANQSMLSIEHAGSAGGGGGKGGESALENDPLGYARSLIVDGKPEKALVYFEDYLKNNPTNVRARIELIQAYLACKHKAKARGLCIGTLKLHLTDMQVAQVWSYFRQCLHD